MRLVDLYYTDYYHKAVNEEALFFVDYGQAKSKD